MSGRQFNRLLVVGFGTANQSVLLCRANRFHGIGNFKPNRQAPFHYLPEVQPPRARLALVDVAWRLPEPGREFSLGQSARNPCLPQKHGQTHVAAMMLRFRSPAAIPLWRGVRHPTTLNSLLALSI